MLYSSQTQLKILQFTEKTFTSFFIDETVDQAIRKFKKTKTTEGYIIDKNNIFHGKINLLNIIDKKNGEKIIYYKSKNPLVLSPNINLLETIKKLSKFVGESIPVVDSQTKQIKGIISENTVLKAYLDVSEEVNFIEKN